MKLSGDREVLRMFEGLPAAAQDRVMKPLVREGGAMLASAEKAEAPSQSGLMKTAIGVSSLKTYASGAVLFITAGVRRGYRRAMQATSRGKLRYFGKQRPAEKPDLPVQDPAKYLHLVTGGRKAIHAMSGKVLFDRRTNRFLGKSVAAAKANPFVSRAFDAAKEMAVDHITTNAATRITAEAAKLL